MIPGHDPPRKTEARIILDKDLAKKTTMIPRHDNSRKTFARKNSATSLSQEHNLDPPDVPPRKT
jgi:hypothetical protein